MNDKFFVRLGSLAKTDIVNIHEYIANVLLNKTAAKKQTEAFLEVFKNLEISPLMYPKVNNELVKEKNIRKVVVNSYIVFYSINEKEQIVDVVRVLYGMMNYQDLL